MRCTAQQAASVASPPPHSVKKRKIENMIGSHPIMFGMSPQQGYFSCSHTHSRRRLRRRQDQAHTCAAAQVRTRVSVHLVGGAHTLQLLSLPFLFAPAFSPVCFSHSRDITDTRDGHTVTHLVNEESQVSWRSTQEGGRNQHAGGWLAEYMVVRVSWAPKQIIAQKSGRCSHDFLLRLHNHSNGPRSRTRTCVIDDLGTDVMRSVQLERVLPQAEGIHETCVPTLTPEKV
jgi:hypothetical protein